MGSASRLLAACATCTRKASCIVIWPQEIACEFCCSIRSSLELKKKFCRLDSHYSVKIADFGLSRYAIDYEFVPANIRRKMAFRWLSLETLKGESVSWSPRRLICLLLREVQIVRQTEMNIKFLPNKIQNSFLFFCLQR